MCGSEPTTCAFLSMASKKEYYIRIACLPKGKRAVPNGNELLRKTTKGQPFGKSHKKRGASLKEAPLYV